MSTSRTNPEQQPLPGSPQINPSSGDHFSVPLAFDSLHDLASPVNQMSSITDLILRKYAGTLDAEAESLFGLLQNAADRLQNLMAGLRTYAQVFSAVSEHRHCNAEEILTAALGMLEQMILQHSVVVTHDELPELHCDPPQMIYAFSSLIENSIKFRSEQTPEIHVGVSEDGQTWIIAVRDNGIGIDPRHHERIFKTFKRIHNDRYPGSGVGLSIAKRVVEQHGGRMWVDSQLGQGATFFMQFPKLNGTHAHRL